MKVGDYTTDIRRHLEPAIDPRSRNFHERGQLGVDGAEPIGEENHEFSEICGESSKKEESDATFNPIQTISSKIDNDTTSNCESIGHTRKSPCVVYKKKTNNSLTERLEERTPSIEILEGTDSQVLPKPFIFCRLIAKFPILSFSEYIISVISFDNIST